MLTRRDSQLSKLGRRLVAAHLMALMGLGLVTLAETGQDPAPGQVFHLRKTAVEPAEPSREDRSQDPARLRLVDEIDRILGRRSYKRASWGIDVHWIEAGEAVYAKSPDAPLSPASNVKIFTTAVALDQLGADFSFTTRLIAEGTLSEKGTLKGDLVLQGGGDPNLSGGLEKKTRPFVYLDRMVRAAQQVGIRVVDGDLIGDDSYFVHAPFGKGWTDTDVQHRYGAAVSALSFYDNVLSLAVGPGDNVGDRLQVSFFPSYSFFSVINRGKTVSSGARKTFAWSGPGDGNRIRLWGNIPISSRKSWRLVTVDDPALYTATVFRERLRKVGIRVTGRTRARHYGESEPAVQSNEVYVHSSLPLQDIIAVINKKSHNLAAEILLRTLGAESSGVGSDEAGLQVVYDFLQEAGVDLATVDLYDGSGLSRDNLITPRAEVLLLSHLAHQPYFPLFMESLAVAGRDGTLKGRMRRRLTRGNVYAKTGSLKKVTTLGGYIRTRSRRTLAFSILVNNHAFSSYTAKRLTDRICEALARY